MRRGNENAGRADAAENGRRQEFPERALQRLPAGTVKVTFAADSFSN